MIKETTANTLYERIQKSMSKNPSAIQIRLNIHLLASFKKKTKEEYILLGRCAKELTEQLLVKIEEETKLIKTREKGLQLQLILNSIKKPFSKDLYSNLSYEMANRPKKKTDVIYGLIILPYNFKGYAIKVVHRRKFKSKDKEEKIYVL